MAKPRAAKNGTIPAGTPTIELTPYGLHVWSDDFLATAKAYHPVARQGCLAGHFLCCQSMELSLKAFLSLKRFSRKALKGKPFGHNLDTLFTESVQRGLGQFVRLNPSDGSIIHEANAWYDTPGDKRLQYFG